MNYIVSLRKLRTSGAKTFYNATLLGNGTKKEWLTSGFTRDKAEEQAAIEAERLIQNEKDDHSLTIKSGRIKFEIIRPVCEPLPIFQVWPSVGDQL